MAGYARKRPSSPRAKRLGVIGTNAEKRRRGRSQDRTGEILFVDARDPDADPGFPRMAREQGVSSTYLLNQQG